MNEWIDWFQRVLDVSIRLYFRQECDLSSVYDIPLPKAGPLWKALLPEQVDPTFDEWMVLMLALMPHLSPQVLDIFSPLNVLDRNGQQTDKKLQINDLWLFLLPESPASKTSKVR